MFFWGLLLQGRKKKGKTRQIGLAPKRRGMEGLAFPIPVKIFNIICI